MKMALTSFTLATLLLGNVAVIAHAEQDTMTTTRTTTTVTTSETPLTPMAPTIALGTDADYNLDYGTYEGEGCKMLNTQIDLTPYQKKRLRSSRLELHKQLMEAGISPEKDPNLGDRKLKAIKPILSEYQFHKYLSLREQCD
jgi:hypothetical protein